MSADTASAAVLPRGSSVEHRIEIGVPADFIWEMLEDVNGWSSWNPIYRAASGSIGIGDLIEMTVALPGMKPQNVKAKVLTSIPKERLHYGSPALGGLLHATRYVEVASPAPHSCIVTNGEVMSGLLGRLVGRGVGPRVREGLQQMNEGLKEAAEAKWREKRG